MTDTVLDAIRELIQEDVCGRGLVTVPGDNLLSHDTFPAACRSIANCPEAAVVVVTGFYIPRGTPPAGETDGPLGALFLARVLLPLGIRVALATDDFCLKPLETGLQAAGLGESVSLVELPADGEGNEKEYWQEVCRRLASDGFPRPSHLVALERVGPTHTPASLREQPGVTAEDIEQFLAEVSPKEHNRCHSMRGLDITNWMRPGHLLFEAARRVEPRVETIGIGDGGNEIGMGSVPWPVIRANIARGGLVACRVPTDHLVVCGVSNWGAYGLAAGILHLRQGKAKPDLFDAGRERELLQEMVERGPLVDGVTGRQEATVDGLSFERYAGVLSRLRDLVAGGDRPSSSP